jgi:hypothetical protein
LHFLVWLSHPHPYNETHSGVQTLSIDHCIALFNLPGLQKTSAPH